jgi:hypothetical protein
MDNDSMMVVDAPEGPRLWSRNEFGEKWSGKVIAFESEPRAAECDIDPQDLSFGDVPLGDWKTRYVVLSSTNGCLDLKKSSAFDPLEILDCVPSGDLHVEMTPNGEPRGTRVFAATLAAREGLPLGDFRGVLHIGNYACDNVAIPYQARIVPNVVSSPSVLYFRAPSYEGAVRIQSRTGVEVECVVVGKPDWLTVKNRVNEEGSWKIVFAANPRGRIPPFDAETYKVKVDVSKPYKQILEVPVVVD